MAFFVFKTFCLFCVVISVSSIPVSYRKHLAGSPSEFSDHHYPNPEDLTTSDSSALLVLKTDLLAKASGLKWVEKELPIDSISLFRLTIASRLSLSSLFFELENPKGELLPLDKVDVVVESWPLSESPSEGNPTLSTYTWSFHDPTPGFWKIRATIRSGNPSSVSIPEKVAIILHNENHQILLNGWLSSFSRLTGEPLTLLSSLSSIETSDISAGAVLITQPDQTQIELRLGPVENSNLLGQKTQWGATFTPTQPGNYNAEILAEGSSFLSKLPFVRSVQLSFTVLSDSLRLTHKASVSKKSVGDYGRLVFHVQVTAPSSTRYLAYAEVYGHSTSGHPEQTVKISSLVPVAWMSSIVNIESSSFPHSNAQFSLELDLDWLVLAGASAPFVLENVYLESPDGVLISSEDSILVDHEPNVPYFIFTYMSTQSPSQVQITERMTQGFRPLALQNQTSRGVQTSTPIIFVHGYCAGANPWRESASIWGEGAYYFEDLDANRDVDEFAELIFQFAEDQGILNSPFATVGHSQGGMAIVHLLNYYWTGMSDLEVGSKVQSLGTPYQGCSIAGSTAALGEIFGVGCGANTDLTVNGAGAWLLGITAETRAEVSFFRTTYATGKVLGDFCNLAANAMLDFPNDGTAEREKSFLDGANDMGVVEEQCHTTDMKYFPQYYDENRNAVICQNARGGTC